VTDERALGVSEVLGLAKRALESVRVRVVGEVSEFTDKSGYKAVYFSIRDEHATMPCLMWRDVYLKAGCDLQVGMLVELDGFLTVYAAKGRMQFQVRRLAPAGEGILRMRVADLARRLEAEGLMDTARKRSLPCMPDRIGLVTSPRGKAVHDVIRTLRRRYPIGELVVAGVKVEGAKAAEEIVIGIERVAQKGGVEVVIVCRGGGSYEDLMPFNDERVARAIASCPVPLVTGIGHEPDTTIADMVSDVRASTPTAAAEAVAPSLDEIAVSIHHLRERLSGVLMRKIADARHKLSALSTRRCIADPAMVLSSQIQRLDIVSGGMARALPLRLDLERDRFARTAESLSKAGRRVWEPSARKLENIAMRLGDLSPLGVLDRGYAICYDEKGKAVRDAYRLHEGDVLDVRFAAGAAGCVVEQVRMEE